MTYTLYRVHSFECDAPRCNAEVEDLGNKNEVWKSFERYGWTSVPTKDGDKHYCPKHAAEVID